MASGSFESTTGTNLEIGCEWSSTADTAANSSSVRVRVYLKHYQIYAAALGGSYVRAGEATSYFTAAASSSASGLQKTYIADKSFTVAHSADGSKSVQISAGWVFNGTYNGHYIGTLTASDTAVLDRIPRASSFSAPSSVTLGAQSSVTVAAASSSYRHRLVMTVGSATSSTQTVSGSTISFTPPASLASGATSSAKPLGTLTLETYSGQTKIGEKVKNCYFVIPSNSTFRPTFSFSLTPSSTSSLVLGAGILAAGLSSATLTVTSPAAKYSAGIASAVITFGTKKVTGATLRTGLITSPGTYSYSAKVTDTRGISATTSGSVTVLPYSAPYPDAPEARRCDANGDASDTGSYLSITSGVVSSSLGGRNAASLSYAVTTRSGTAVTGGALTAGQTSIVAASLSPTASYVCTITASDTAGQSTVYRVTIPTSKVDVHLKDASLRLGGYVERAGFECDWDARFGGDVYLSGDAVSDFVTSCGVSGIWTWRKYSSGAAECFGTVPAATYALSSSYGAFYRSSTVSGEALNSVAYPQGLFIAPPTVTATAARSNASVLLCERSAGSASASPNYYIIYPSLPASGSVDAGIHVAARGRWK